MPVTWRLALTVALVAITAVGVVVNEVVATPTSGFSPIDYTTFAPHGVEILHGQWDSVFSDSIVQAGPIELLFWGIPAVLGVHGLIGWIAFSVFTCSLFAILFAFLAERLLRPLTPVWSTTLAVGIVAIASLVGLLASAISTGHPAEIAVPTMWIGSAVLARRGRPFAAATMLAATAGWELWGLLAVPVLLLAPRIDFRTVWRSAAGGILMLALIFLPFALLGPFEMFTFHWAIRVGTLAHLLFPDVTTFAWPLRLVQGVLAVGAGAVAALLTRDRPDAIWLPLLVVCVVRLFTDPVLAPYYGIPPVMMLLVGSAMSIAQRALVPFLACVVMLNVFVDVPLTVVTAAILVVLAVVITLVVARSGGAMRPVAVDVRGAPDPAK